MTTEDDKLTYHSRAIAEADTQGGGRFARLTPSAIVGCDPSPYPKLPDGNPFANDPVGPEVPFGEDINALPDMMFEHAAPTNTIGIGTDAPAALSPFSAVEHRPTTGEGLSRGSQAPPHISLMRRLR